MENLPHGTVTFLLSNIVDSAPEWESDPRAMADAVARYETITRQAIETGSGRVFKTVGDALFAAFASPFEALLAAFDCQTALQADDQFHTDEPRVRMAVHTGAPSERDGDYFGPPMNHVARMLELAQGGQVLVSRTTSTLANDVLPETMKLRHLGTRRLRGIERQERIFELVAPGLV